MSGAGAWVSFGLMHSPFRLVLMVFDPTRPASPPRPDPEAPSTAPPEAPAAAPDIEATLGLDAAGDRHRRWRWGLALLVLLLVGAAAAWWAFRGDAAVAYETVPVRRGTLTLSVTATGTLGAVNTVDVGSEISGLVEAVLVDANDRVAQGQALARLDTDRLEAEVMQARANVQAARAAGAQAEATREEQRLQTARAEQMADRGFISEQEWDAARAALARAEAAVTSAEAQVDVAEAALDVAQTTLRKAVVRSPIDGVVLSRAVDPGQAVAASFQTPVLFTVAEDLTRMELHVDVDEADVGPVADGQDATFTVDAYPDRTFPAVVTKVHYASKTVSGVVTYEAVLAVDNAAGVLRPGMTATATITTGTVADTLLVPNSAFRFTPPVVERPPVDSTVVWTLDDGTPAARAVTPGATDGQWTVVRAGAVEPGLPLLVNLDQPSP